MLSCCYVNEFCSSAVYFLEKAELIILLMGKAIRDINVTFKTKRNKVWKVSKDYEAINPSHEVLRKIYAKLQKPQNI